MFLWAFAPGACLMFQDSSGGFAAGGPATAVGASGDGLDAGVVGDDAHGADDGDPDPGGGMAMGCSSLPFGCVCSPGEPTQVRACTRTSVAMGPGQRGVCCGNPFQCICLAYECVRIGGGCSCQLAAPGGGTRVDDCSAVTANASIKCCRSFGQCVCSSTACLFTETSVPSCSVDDLLACPPGDTSVTTCEPFGSQSGVR